MSNPLEKRTIALHYELKDYIEALEKKYNNIKETAFKGKIDNIELFDEEEILDTGYDVFQSKIPHQMDVMLLELDFIITYKNTLFLEPKTKFEEDIKNAYNAIKIKHKPFFVLEKEGTFKSLDDSKLDKMKQTFKQQIDQVGGLGYITEQLEKELKR